jgi:glutamate racemase
VIGVFDSGFGGLTVLRSLVARLPEYDYFYLGDSARAPYGGRSLEVVHSFTREAVEFLFDAGCPLVVLACNTASAQALRTLQQRHLPAHRPDRRILGVVRPSAEALAGLPPGAIPGVTQPSLADGTVAVLGTVGTVASGSYALELAKLAPRLRLIEQACPLWVPLVEAGETSGPGVDYFLHKYLDPLFARTDPPSRLLLGCTHYPLLQTGIRAMVPSAGRDHRPGRSGSGAPSGLAGPPSGHGAAAVAWRWPALRHHRRSGLVRRPWRAHHARVHRGGACAALSLASYQPRNVNSARAMSVREKTERRRPPSTRRRGSLGLWRPNPARRTASEEIARPRRARRGSR